MNSGFIYSQTKDPVVVTVDLEAGTIGKVPFDQPYKLSSFQDCRIRPLCHSSSKT